MTSKSSSRSIPTLVVGVGSPHGDDQAGWKVVEKLGQLSLLNVELRQASVPHDLLDWLENIARLVVIDSCDGDEPIDRVGDWNSAGLSPFRSAGTHQIDILTVLELARSLELLPPTVAVWGIPGRSFRPNEPLTPFCSAHVTRCVSKLARELSDA